MSKMNHKPLTETERREILDACLARLDAIVEEKGEGVEFFAEMERQLAVLSNLYS